ncbi:MAG: tRNA (N(6)-L-threonylcarbamoyladenosine(37)-C(2))-methylthiotransferase [Candidatus Bathyarchaeota archaeon]|nr:tRNA (N(6)-L-threonylcarbamoyladenosine(37)-C(2))-methylthiotransferase [Candidatus Bathyarchaeota archaeon]
MPGTARVYVEVFGCSANAADSEIASGLLVEAGHALADGPGAADASVVLTCTVKTPTENKVVRRIRELSAGGMPLVVAGCMPKAQRELVAEAAPNASMVGPDNLIDIVDVVEETMGGGRVEEIHGGPLDRTCLPRARLNPVVHIAPIASGCRGSCSYCIVRRARGTLNSYPSDSIVEDARRALGEGCREIWVTAEDTAAYNWRGARLPQLLSDLTDLEGRFFVRIGMMNPDQATPLLDDLIESYGSGKVFKFLHLPVQSGNDGVLRRMRRRYTVEDFRTIVHRFRGAFTMLTLSTDVICGFPGETEDEFGDSLRLVDEVEPEVLNISRFWPRPGTEAERMEGQLHGRDTKRRSRALSARWRGRSLERSRRWIGWRGEVVVDEEGRGDSMVGRNYAYKPVVVKEPVDLGDFVSVEVTEARGGYLLGRTF